MFSRYVLLFFRAHSHAIGEYLTVRNSIYDAGIPPSRRDFSSVCYIEMVQPWFFPLWNHGNSKEFVNVRAPSRLKARGNIKLRGKTSEFDGTPYLASRSFQRLRNNNVF